MIINSIFKNIIKGNYPIAYLIYKTGLNGKIIKNPFPIKPYRLFFDKKKYREVGGAEQLLIETYDGLGQSVHPSVICEGGRYVMAFTPFPYGNDYYENPCIVTSKDGLLYKDEYKINPLVLPNKHDKLIYLSDPYIYRQDNEYKLIFRECEYADNTHYRANIYMIRSRSLSDWTEKELLFSGEQGEMCPIVLYIGDREWIYTVIFEGKKTKMIRRCRLNGTFDTATEDVLVEGVPDGEMLWHFDFFRYREKNFCLLTTSTDHYGSGAKLYLACGDDNGLQWKVEREIVLDKKLITKTYKACAVVHADQRVEIFISVRRKDRAWMTYRIPDFEVERR